MNELDKVKLFVPMETLESEAITQIKNISQMPFVFKHVAVMPDCHVGKGATVGTVIATKGAVIPAAVGVDIGCGMIAVRTALTRELFDAALAKQGKTLTDVREGIERRIPVSAGKFNSKITESAKKRIMQLETDARIHARLDFYDAISPNWRDQVGTLGGGNHFIEVCVDQDNIIWIVLHSGSRGIGNKIGNHHIKVAQILTEQKKIKLVDRDLAYLEEGEEEFRTYLHDLRWAQAFALANRDEMMDRVLTELSFDLFGEDGHQRGLQYLRINCHHNFTQQEKHFGETVWLTRKGAIEATRDKMAVIPGSMGTRSYIVSGLGNADSFNSAPHGAGRRFSRAKAKERFTMEDLTVAMVGIEFNPKEAFIDEIPGAYKDIDEVMVNAKELVKIEHTLKQIINVKGE